VLLRALHPRTLMFFDGEGGGGGGEGGSGGDGAPQTFTQDQVNDLLAREKGKITAKFADYGDLKAKAGELDQLKSASQTDTERLTGQVTKLTGANDSLKGENMRLKVALRKGLVGDKAVLADRLTGKNEAEMEADADELLKLFGGPASGGGFDGGARGGADQPQDMNSLLRAARRR